MADDKQPEADEPISHDDFVTYFNFEIKPAAEKFGYRATLEQVDSDEEFLRNWPSWFYDPATKEGRIFNHPSEVPEGWTTNPF